MELPGLPPAQVAPLLESTLAMIQAEVAALNENQLRWQPAEGEWCVLEVIGHLTEAEQRGFGGRIRTFLEQDNPTCVTWDQDAVARDRRDHERDPRTVLDEFTAVRCESIEMVKALRPHQLNRYGEHPQVGRLTVRDLLHEWVHHDRNHVKQILANIQGEVWPHIGNAQRFVEID
jgi:hypothetical protein